jgi:hypothetical protein
MTKRNGTGLYFSVGVAVYITEGKKLLLEDKATLPVLSRRPSKV